MLRFEFLQAVVIGITYLIAESSWWHKHDDHNDLYYYDDLDYDEIGEPPWVEENPVGYPTDGPGEYIVADNKVVWYEYGNGRDCRCVVLDNPGEQEPWQGQLYLASEIPIDKPYWDYGRTTHLLNKDRFTVNFGSEGRGKSSLMIPFGYTGNFTGLP